MGEDPEITQERYAKMQIREAKRKGKDTGFKLGAAVALALAAGASVALNKNGVNLSDKLTKAYDKSAAKVKEVASKTKKHFDEKK